MSEIKLKPCPFCGGEAYTYTCTSLNHGKKVKNWLIHCKECHLNYPNFSIVDRCLTEEEAIKHWNTRKPIERALGRLEEESRLAEEDQEYARAHNPLQYERCDSYLTAIDNAIEIIKEEVG